MTMDPFMLIAIALPLAFAASRPSSSGPVDEWLKESRAETERLKARTEAVREKTRVLRDANERALADLLQLMDRLPACAESDYPDW